MSISVLMSVYNGEKASFLELSLESIAAQTLQADQIVLVKDGPLNDDLETVITRFKQELPLTIVNLEKNSGLARALNRGLTECKNEFIARMDSDDVCDPNRFKIQMEFMLKNPRIDLVGSYAVEMCSKMLECRGIKKTELQMDDIIRSSKFMNPIQHPTVFARKRFFEISGPYPEIYPEDYLLWIRAMRRGAQMANIPQALVYARTGAGQLDRRGFRFLRGEILAFWEMYKFKQLSAIGFIVAVAPRVLIRVAPRSIRNRLIFQAKKWLHYGNKI